MNTYVALLRGINVSGQKLIKMAELRESLKKAGFQQVQTYIQSGNIVFQSDETDLSVLEAGIKTVILKDFGHEVPTMVKTVTHLEKAVEKAPFTDPDPTRVHLILLNQEPEKERLDKLAEGEYSPQKYHVDGDNIYLYTPKGLPKAKLTNNFFESKLKVTATARNWRTVHKLIEMSKQ